MKSLYQMYRIVNALLTSLVFMKATVSWKLCFDTTVAL